MVSRTKKISALLSRRDNIREKKGYGEYRHIVLYFRGNIIHETENNRNE